MARRLHLEFFVPWAVDSFEVMAMNKRNFVLIVIFLAFSLMFSSCAVQKNAGRPSAPSLKQGESLREADGSSPRDKEKITGSLQRKIIRTANLIIYVENLEKAMGTIEGLTRQYSGQVAGKTTSISSGYRNGTLTLWVPSSKLLHFVDEIKKTGNTTNSTINAQDISDQYYDLDARLRNARRQEDRMLELLKQKGNDLKSILSVEKELARIRSDIETMDGRRRRWDQQVAYSTVTVSLYQDVKAAREPDDILKPLRRAIRELKPTFVSSLGVIVKFSAWVLTAVAALIPWLVFIGVILWIVRRVMRGRFQHQVESRLPRADLKKDVEKSGKDI